MCHVYILGQHPPHSCLVNRLARCKPIPFKQFLRKVGRKLVKRGAAALARQILPSVGNGSTVLMRGYQTPPPCFTTKTLPFTQRYQLNVAGSYGITIADLLDSYFTAASATAGYRVFVAMKIKKIEIWGPAITTVATPNQISFIWGAPQAADDFAMPCQVVSDLSLGSNDVSHICLRPPSDGLYSKWFGSTSSTDQVFYVEAPAGAIMDLHLVAVLYDGSGGGTGFTPAAVVSTIAGATPGYIYSRSLPANNANGWIPVNGAVV